MNHRVSRRRRLFAGPLAMAIGVIGAVALAAPASAQTATVYGQVVCDATSGDWVITWTVANDQADRVATIHTVQVTPNADISPIASNAIVPKQGDGVLTATQRVSAGAASLATLNILVGWDRVTRDHAKDTVDLRGECTTSPGPSPAPTASPPATPSPEPTAGPPTSPSPEPTASTSPTEATSPSPEPAASDGGQGGGDRNNDLPETGTNVGLIAGGAGALLALGAGLFLIARRRRITFTA